jgi:hypothetical protein
MPISTNTSSGSAPNTPSTTTALIESDTLLSRLSASEIETYYSSYYYLFILEELLCLETFEPEF